MTGARAWRLLGSLAPVIAVYLLILATLPYGTFIAHTLYRIGPDAVTERVPLPGDGVEIAVILAGRVVRLADGGIAFFDRAEARGVPTLPAPCAELGHFRGSDVVVCPMGPAGVAVLRPDEAGNLRADVLDLAVDATAGVEVSGRVVVGTADGRVLLVDPDATATLRAGEGPVRRVRVFGTTLVVAVGDEVVLYDVGGAPAEVARLDLGAPVVDLERGEGRYYALTAETVTGLDLTDPRAPRIVGTLAAPAPLARLKMSLRSVGFATLQGGGVRVLRDAGDGPMWWGPVRGEVARSTACGGPWGALACVGPGPNGPEIRVFDVLASKYGVVGGVGLLAVLGVLGLVGWMVFTRPPGWPVRLGWLAATLGAASWLLAGTLHTPVEALHVLEYGALGLLCHRAVTREFGAGPAAAALAALVGVGFGLLDETLQHLHPVRTGSLVDVGLDGQAAAVGVALGWLALRVGGDRPHLSWSAPWFAAALLVPGLLGLQHAAVGFGYAYEAPGLAWTSALSERASAGRAGDPEAKRVLTQAATMDYADFLATYADEPYLYELRVRLYRRDMRMLRGDPEVACAEARIVERVFGPTVAGTPFAWDAGAWARCAGTGAGEGGDPAAPTYVSPVGEGRMTWISAFLAWALALGAAAALAAVGWAVGRRRARVTR